MKCSWRDVLGIGFAGMLFGAAVWANLTESSPSQLKGAWVSQAMR